jgi:hypothetical protein
LTVIGAAAALLISSCEPDNPLRSQDLVFSYYGTLPGEASIYSFKGDGEIGETVSGNIIPSGSASSLDYIAGQYYLLTSEPAILYKLDSTMSVAASIPLSAGDQGEIYFANSTTAFYHPAGSDQLQVVDLFFDRVGQTYTLPWVPASIVTMRNEESGNRLLLMGENGEIVYMSLKDYEIDSIAATGLSGGLLIENELDRAFYALGSIGEGITAIKYDSETGEELSRFTNPTNLETNTQLMDGVWGGFNFGYFATAEGLWRIQDFESNFTLIPLDLDFTPYAPQTVIAKANRSKLGISFLLNGPNGSHFLSFKDGAAGKLTPVALNRQFNSYEAID